MHHKDDVLGAVAVVVVVVVAAVVLVDQMHPEVSMNTGTVAVAVAVVG